MKHTLAETIAKACDADGSVAIRDRARLLIDESKKLGLKSVSATFSGSGDSGEISGIEFLNSSDKAIHRHKWNEKDGSYTENTDVPRELWELASKVVDDLVGKLAGDWWNNDGGYGSVSVNLETGRADVTASYQELRVCETEEKAFNLPCYGTAEV